MSFKLYEYTNKWQPYPLITTNRSANELIFHPFVLDRPSNSKTEVPKRPVLCDALCTI